MCEAVKPVSRALQAFKISPYIMFSVQPPLCDASRPCMAMGTAGACHSDVGPAQREKYLLPTGYFWGCGRRVLLDKDLRASLTCPRLVFYLWLILPSFLQARNQCMQEGMTESGIKAHIPETRFGVVCFSSSTTATCGSRKAKRTSCCFISLFFCSARGTCPSSEDSLCMPGSVHVTQWPTWWRKHLLFSRENEVRVLDSGYTKVSLKGLGLLSPVCWGSTQPWRPPVQWGKSVV